MRVLERYRAQTDTGWSGATSRPGNDGPLYPSTQDCYKITRLVDQFNTSDWNRSEAIDDSLTREVTLRRRNNERQRQSTATMRRDAEVAGALPNAQMPPFLLFSEF